MNQTLKRILFIFLIILLGFDLLQSAYHYYNLSFDGDFVRIGLPFKWYEDIMNDPWGLNAVLNNKEYAGAGRYMCHASTVWWCSYAYSAIHHFVKDPVVSIYLLTSSIAMLVHMLYLVVVYLYVNAFVNLNRIQTLILIVFASIFIQYGRMYSSIGIIDRSASYVFFYGLPIMIFLLYFYPYIYYFQKGQLQIPLNIRLIMMPLAIFCSFSSVLVQPVVFVLLFVLGVFYFLSPSDSAIRNYLSSKSVLTQLAWLFILCVYVFYVAQFNSEKNTVVSLAERYSLLLRGLWLHITSNFAIISILSLHVVFYLLIQRFVPSYIKRYQKIILFTYLFIFVYLSLLPLGGYRVYRPFIVRYDTFIPCSLLLFFVVFLGFSILISSSLSSKSKMIFMTTSVAFYTLFFLADISIEKDHNQCQQDVLYALHHDKSNELILPTHCNLCTWDVSEFHDPVTQDMINRMMKQWGVIESYQKIVVLPAK